MDVSLSELRELVMNREAWSAVIHGVAKTRKRLSDWTELNWTGAVMVRQSMTRETPEAPVACTSKMASFRTWLTPALGCLGQLCTSLARLSFYPQPLNVARWVSLQNGGLGVVKMIISWLASPRVSTRETLEGYKVTCDPALKIIASLLPHSGYYKEMCVYIIHRYV